MRVLHMIPDISVSNGVMSFICNYAKAMPSDIVFDVVYFCEKQPNRQSDVESWGGRVYKIDPPSPKDIFGGKMNAFFSQHKGEWSALHIHCPHFAPFIAPSAKRAGIKNIFVHCHTTEYSLVGNSRRNQILSLYAKYFIDNKFACSKKSGDFWYGNKAYRILSNSVDCKAYEFNPDVRSSIRSQFGFGDSLVIAHIGKTDVKQKNHPFILRIFEHIKASHPTARLMLIGAEPTDELTTLCNSLNIQDNVMFLGARNDVKNLLQAADVFLFPSISEGLPVSVVEAQAAGLPVVMSDTITREVAVCGDVVIKSLDDGAASWADDCIAASKAVRKSTYSQLVDSGWDITKNAARLANIYKSRV